MANLTNSVKYDNQVEEEEKEQIGRNEQAGDIGKFPVDVFKGTPVYEFLDESKKAFGFHPDALAGSIISCLGTCIGKKVKLHVKNGFVEPSSFYIVNIGPSGTAKSPTVKHALNPLLKMDKIAPIVNGIPITHCTQDFTQEGIIKLLKQEESNGVLIYGDEMKQVIGSLGQYKKDGNADEAFILQAWSGGTYTKHRAGKENSFHIDDINLNIIMNGTPEVLDLLANSEHLNSGFYSRFLFVYPQEIVAPKYNSDTDLDQEIIDGYHELCMKLDRMSGNIKLNTEADKAYEKYDHEVKDFIDRIYDNTKRAVLSKSTNYVLRFSLLFALIRIVSEENEESVMEVTLPDMEKAIKVMRYFNLKNDKIRYLLVDDEIPTDMKGKTNDEKREFVLKLARTGRLKNIQYLAKQIKVSRGTIYRWISANNETK